LRVHSAQSQWPSRPETGLYLAARCSEGEYVSTRLEASRERAPEIHQKEFPFLDGGLAVTLKMRRLASALQMDEVVVCVRMSDFLSTALTRSLGCTSSVEKIAIGDFPG